MRLLLTSSGITNESIRAALVALLGKPIEQCRAICIPTAIYALAGGGTEAWPMPRVTPEPGASMDTARAAPSTPVAAPRVSWGS